LPEIVVALAVVAIAGFYAVARSSKLAAGKATVIWMTLVVTNIGFTVFSFWRIGYAHTLLLYVPLLTIAVAGFFFFNEPGNVQRIKEGWGKPLSMVLGLMLLSVITAAGSNNVLGWEMANYFAPMMISYWVAYLAIARYLKSPIFLFVAATALLLTCFAVFFQGSSWSPMAPTPSMSKMKRQNGPNA
jgi:hypothetical protein